MTNRDPQLIHLVMDQAKELCTSVLEELKDKNNVAICIAIQAVAVQVQTSMPKHWAIAKEWMMLEQQKGRKTDG
jgi:hypothetical protein